ncbi:MAG: hypothetical protein AAF703_17645 [Cyanobacteria bacterium P01_D01_bin.105]
MPPSGAGAHRYESSQLLPLDTFSDYYCSSQLDKSNRTTACRMTIFHYPNLGAAIQGVCQAWCQAHDYTDPFCRDGEWWAFPPHGVMPVRIKAVMGNTLPYVVVIEPLTLKLFPDGSLAKVSDM